MDRTTTKNSIEFTTVYGIVKNIIGGYGLDKEQIDFIGNIDVEDDNILIVHYGEVISIKSDSVIIKKIADTISSYRPLTGSFKISKLYWNSLLFTNIRKFLGVDVYDVKVVDTESFITVTCKSNKFTVDNRKWNIIPDISNGSFELILLVD